MNGGGYVEREVGVARGRIDLHVRWPYASPDGKRAWQVFALELKAWAAKKKDPLEEGLKQVEGYLAGLGLDEGTLVIFDRRPDAPPPEERTRFEEARTASGRRIVVLRA